MSVSLQAEERAMTAYAGLLEQARSVSRLFMDAGMSPPPSLARFLGSDATRSESWIPMPPTARPNESKADWIWVKADSLFPWDLVLALLRQGDKPRTPTSLMREVIDEYKVKANPNSILNVFPRMEEQGLIVRSDDGWELKDKTAAPILVEGYAWGPYEGFQKYSVAAYRRMLILALLKAIPGGLMTMQILERMKAARDVYAGPLTKELVIDDMDVLRKDRAVRRPGATKKWVLNEEAKG